MKPYLIIFFFALLSFKGLGQISNVDFIMAHWTSGVYDSNDSIVEFESPKGGPSSLHINADSSASYSTGFNCGFGSFMTGTWTLDSDTLILNFTSVEAYRDYPDFDSRPRIRKYKIKYLSQYGLILMSYSGSEELYCVSENSNP